MNKNVSIFKTILIFLMPLFLFGCKSDERVFQGYVEGVYTHISSAVSGNLTKNLVSKGGQVKANQPLFVLDPQPETDILSQAEFQLDQAKQRLLDLQKGARPTVIENIKAQLKRAKADHEFADKTYKRYQRLYPSGAIGKAKLDEASSQYKQSLQAVKAIEAQLADSLLGARENQILAQKAIVKGAEAAVKKAQWALLQKSVRSPVSAHVFSTVYDPGEFVGAGQPAVVLLSPENIKVIFFVSEKIISQLSIGDKVVIDCDSCKDSYGAKVTFISPNAEFTPPVIFSKDSREKLVYKVEAKTSAQVAKTLHPGQPVDVIIEGIGS